MFFVLLAILFSNCTNELIGTYGSATRAVVELRSDSSFLFSSGNGYSYSYSKGVFKKIDKNNFSLQSSIINKTLLLGIDEATNLVSNDSIGFNINLIVYNNYKELYDYAITINDTLKLQRNGLVDNFKIKKLPINKLEMVVFGEERSNLSAAYDTLRTPISYLKNPNSNLIRLNLAVDYKLFNFRIFQDYHVKYSKRKLLFDSNYLHRSRSIPNIR